MSSNHQRRNLSGLEICHVRQLSDNIGSLLYNPEHSDVTLVVEGVHLPAHKLIMASSSDYFRALLYGGLKESRENVVHISATNANSFKLLLKYIYTGCIQLSELEDETILDIIGLAHQYGFQKLESSLCDYFAKALTVENVFIIYDSARLYGLKPLHETCLAFIDSKVAPILSSSYTQHLSLSPEGFKEIISRDSFFVAEVKLFEIVLKWAEHNKLTGSKELEDVLSKVRFELMTINDLCSIVRPSGMVNSDVLLDAIETKTENPSKLRHRGYLSKNVNMADRTLGTVVIQGEMKQALLDGNAYNYDMESGYTRHCINNAGDSILIELGNQCIVNHIKMLLWDKDLRSYSYFIEVSMDKTDWVKVIDHTNYFCRSWQKLFFEPRVVKYVRITGTHNTVNTVFHIVAFEIMFSTENFSLVDGVLKPSHNVATAHESASVLEGVCRSRNSLLDGNVKIYDWNKGYTCHQIGSGAILVQLGQPYMLESMKLLLWDCDERCYSYYIQVSVNKRDWETVWDKRKELCRSWQHITFQMRPVVFVKIIGTQNTANEVFHCVHFECPAGSPVEFTPAVVEPVVESDPLQDSTQNVEDVDEQIDIEIE